MTPPKADLLADLITIRDDLTEVTPDAIPMSKARFFNRALNRLDAIIAAGERHTSQQHLKVAPRSGVGRSEHSPVVEDSFGDV
jgi:hypothetical protein